MYSYITHPDVDVARIVVTRFDASTGTSVTWEDGALVEQPSFGGPEAFAFPEPYGEQEVHIVPHPEPVTIPRTIDVGTGGVQGRLPGRRDARIETLLELGSTASARSTSMAARSPPAGSRPRTSAVAASAQRTGARTSSTSGSRAPGPDARSRSSTTSPSSRSADPRRRRSPGPSRRSPRTWSRGAGQPGSMRPRRRSTRAGFVDALAERGLTIAEREIAG
jgi:hypothetical protein